MTVKICAVSDNHGQSKWLDVVRELHHDCDYFIHCGDVELPQYLMTGFIVVQGNNDAWNAFPANRVVEIEGHRIYVTHSHREMYLGRTEMLADKAKSLECDIVFYGHTHIYNDVEVDGIRLLNPGSIWHNRDGSDPSYMIVTIDGDVIKAERKTYKI